MSGRKNINDTLLMKTFSKIIEYEEIDYYIIIEAKWRERKKKHTNSLGLFALLL